MEFVFDRDFLMNFQAAFGHFGIEPLDVNLAVRALKRWSPPLLRGI
jgi:hypothetical protein